MNANLKFDTMWQAEEHLTANNWRLADGVWFRTDTYHDIRFVQPMRETGVMLAGDDGSEYPELEPVDGVHINILCSKGCCKSNIAVETPCEVWS